MQYVRLGSAGLKVSRIGLGMMGFGRPEWRSWVLDEASAIPVVRRAVESGIIFFDTSDVYSSGASEEITGNLLGKFFARREDFVLATKVRSPTGPGPNDRGLSRKRVFAAIDDSLRRLRTDYVDLYQIHHWDYETPLEETLAALDDLVRAGKVRYLGLSNVLGWQLGKVQHVAERNGWTRVVSVQNEYNLLYREDERELVPSCLDDGVGLVPWSPLARGLLAGSRSRDGSRRTVRARTDDRIEELYGADSDADVVEAVRATAADRGVPPAQVALAWLLRQPAVSAPVLGATRPEHVSDAVAALDLALTDAEAASLERLYRPHANRLSPAPRPPR